MRLLQAWSIHLHMLYVADAPTLAMERGKVEGKLQSCASGSRNFAGLISTKTTVLWP